jgi:DNA-binding transcriptional ArsR family regulator
MRVPYNKLVRDRIPEIIRADGHQPVTRILDQDGYQAAGERRIVDLAAELGGAQANSSSHLASLKACGLITRDQVGGAITRLTQPRGAGVALRGALNRYGGEPAAGQAGAVDLGFGGEVADFYHQYRRGHPSAVIDALVDTFGLTR